MKKIVLAFVLFVAGALIMSCERNELYDNSGEDLLAVLTPGSSLNSPQAIYIYEAGQTPNGNLGGRAGADALCQSIAPPPFPVTTVQAFISVSSIDTMSALVPPAYHGLPVYNYSGANLISATWTDLWDGTIDITLGAAGVLPPGLEWWTGSNSDGTCNASNCLGWTSAIVPDTGMMGNTNFTNAFWINWATPTCDSTINYLLCVAY